VVVTGHQLNFLPGLSVISKIQAADALIVMDEMQYERHGFVNRNRLANGSWMTIPVADDDTFKPINRVRIADPTGRAREKVARTIDYALGANPFAAEIRKPYRLLAGLNERLLALLMFELGCDTAVHSQSRLESGRYGDTSEGLAEMVAEVGGTVWLSGSSGRRYLDEAPFAARGIEVRYWQHDGPNPCALELLR
jgi:hypothetical protein